MKQKERLKETRKREGKRIQEFVKFGNKKSVFWTITIAVIVLTIIGMSLTPGNKNLTRYLSLIWIVEAMYIWIYLETRRKYNLK